jgi:hypothetical protein
MYLNMFFLLNRNDRTGSILQTMFYIYAFCYKHGIKYNGLISDSAWWYNTKFFNYVENYFCIKNKVIKDKSTLEFIEFDYLIQNKKIKDSDYLFTIFESKHYKFFQNNINYYFDNSFKSTLSVKKIGLNNNSYIAVHIRRGDVNNSIKRRYTNDETYLNLIKKIRNNNPQINYDIHIFSENKFNGNKNLFQQLPNVYLHLEKTSGFHDFDNIFRDLSLMIHSDIFICSKSSFSYFPAILKKNGVVYHNNNFWNPPLNTFLVYDDITGEIVK